MKRYKAFCLLMLTVSAVEAQSIDSLTFGQLKSDVKAGVKKLGSRLEGNKFFGKVKLLSASDMDKWSVPAANYSGIAPLSEDSFAVVDDKSFSGGFYVFHINMDQRTGKILSVSRGPFYGAAEKKTEDCEDIVYVPTSKTLFITSEENSMVEEYDLKGNKTGRKFHLPECFNMKNIRVNNGFESLAHDNATGQFWMTTETPLISDEEYKIGAESLQVLRLQQYRPNLEPQGWWAYSMEAPRLKSGGKIYTFGVPAILSLGHDELLVMEREAYVPNNYIGAKTSIRIFRVKLSVAARQNETSSVSSVPVSALLQKTEVASFTTQLSLTQMNWANYEGMCLGPRLEDGSPTLLLISDSQGGYGNNIYHLKDYLKVVVLPKDFLP